MAARSPYDILRALANQGGKKARPDGSEKTLVPWSLVEEAREFCGANWRYGDFDPFTGKRIGEKLTTHPKPEPDPDRLLPPGKTCEDCKSFAFCRRIRNVSGMTSCTTHGMEFKPRGRARYSRRGGGW